jgi:hypothetical protein
MPTFQCSQADEECSAIFRTIDGQLNSRNGRQDCEFPASTFESIQKTDVVFAKSVCPSAQQQEILALIFKDVDEIYDLGDKEV